MDRGERSGFWAGNQQFGRMYGEFGRAVANFAGLYSKQSTSSPKTKWIVSVLLVIVSEVKQSIRKLKTAMSTKIALFTSCKQCKSSFQLVYITCKIVVASNFSNIISRQGNVF